MTYEQIINLWKLGYSKKYMYDLEYLDLKNNSFLEDSSNLELEKKARFNVDSTLSNEYRKFV